MVFVMWSQVTLIETVTAICGIGQHGRSVRNSVWTVQGIAQKCGIASNFQTWWLEQQKEAGFGGLCHIVTGSFLYTVIEGC
ncbi:hypothetical protein PSSHI_18720 [Photobacterium sp. R1]